MLPGDARLNGNHEVIFINRYDAVQCAEVQHHGLRSLGQVAPGVGHTATALRDGPACSRANADGISDLRLCCGLYDKAGRFAARVDVGRIESIIAFADESTGAQSLTQGILQQCGLVSGCVHLLCSV